MTALLIAGGSDGVFRLFTKLGLRNPIERKQKALKRKEELEKETAKKSTGNTDPNQVQGA